MKKTFTFLSSQYVGYIYHSICKLQHAITYTQLKGIFSLNESDNCCKVSYPTVLAAPSLSSSFKHIQCVQSLKVQITSRMTKDLFNKLKVPKAEMHSFLISTRTLGDDYEWIIKNTKMGTTNPTQAIILRVIPKEIEEKIKQNALYGDCKTINGLKQKVLIFQQMSHIIIRDFFLKMIFFYKKSEIYMERVL